LERLLPVEYFHVVFTLPEQLQPLVLKNRRLVYDLLFRAASETLLELAADPKRLGAQIGVTAILHTWGQNLRFHPHLHCVVTGGGLSPDGTRWVSGRKGYFLPVKVLSKLFRGKFLAGLKAAQAADQLEFKGSVSKLANPLRFRQFLEGLYRQAFVVYAKPPFGGAEQVFRYLGRYTHRVAIANGRLISLEEGQVRFHYKDYADGSTWKVMSLSAEEFIRRFLMHVLPKRFVRIRHYGLLAGRNVPTKLALCQELLRDETMPRPAAQSKADGLALIDPIHLVCPHCGHPLRRHSFDGESARTGRVATGAVNDTS
jgi:hypothetical protein